MLRCGGCGRMLAPYGKTDKIKYYCKYKTLIDNADCLYERVSEQEIADVVGEAVRIELLRTADIIKTQSEIEARAKLHRNKVQHLQSQIDRLKHKKVDGYIGFTKGEITDEEFQNTKDEIVKQIAFLRMKCRRNRKRSCLPKIYRC